MKSIDPLPGSVSRTTDGGHRPERSIARWVPNLARRTIGLALFALCTGCQWGAENAAPTKSPATANAPTRIIILRHAEKPADELDPHLSSAGREHALAWVPVLTAPDGPLYGQKPAALFAPHPTKGHPSVRPIETLQPFAESVARPIQSPFSSADVGSLADLVQHRYRGQTVVICWVHEQLPNLVRALGVTTTPPPWKGKDFHQIWVVDYPDGHARLSRFGTSP